MEENPSSQQESKRGEPWALGSVLGYSSANIFDRVSTANPLIEPMLRGLPSLLMALVLMVRNKTWGQMRPGSPEFIGRRAILPFIWAGFLSTSGLFLYYFAIPIGGVTITIPVLETYVIWGTVIAWFFLGERIRALSVLGVVLIAGGLVVLSIGQGKGEPISQHWYWAIPLALLAALTYGISGVLWRDGQLRGAHQSTAIFLHFTTSMAVAVVGWLAMGGWGALSEASARDVGALLASGVLSGIVGIYCMFTALRRMSVARVYAFSALTPLVATLFARFFLQEYLNAIMLAGIVLVSCGVGLTQIFRPRDEKQAG